MNTKWIERTGPDRNRRAFTFAGIINTFAISGLAVLTGFGALTSGLGTTRASQEDVRATHVLREKLETIGHCKWDELNSNRIPLAFVVPFNDGSKTSHEDEDGFHYYGQVAIEPSGTKGFQDADTRRVTVRLQWTTGYIPKTRALTTNFSRSGPQELVGR